MNEQLKNPYDLPLLYSSIMSTSGYNSFIHSYLFLSNKFSYRNSDKQIKIIQKFVKAINKQLDIVITKKKGKVYKLISSYDSNLHVSILNEQSSSYQDDFEFIFENVLEDKFKIIVFENNAFPQITRSVANMNYMLFFKTTYNSEVIFYPIFNSEKYVFSNNDTIIELLINMKTDSNNTKDESVYISKSKQDENITSIIFSDDIIFEDIDDEIEVIYSNDEENQIFSNDEKINLIQNLVVSSSSKIFNQTFQFFDIFSNHQPMTNVLYDKFAHQFYVSNINQLFHRTNNDDINYIETFNEYKLKYNYLPYIDSVFSSDNKESFHTYNNDVIRNAFFEDQEKLDNFNNITIDETFCLENFNEKQLRDIAKQHNIEFISKKKSCKLFTIKNFLEDYIKINYFDKIPKEELEAFAENNDINIEGGKKKILNTLLKFPSFVEKSNKFCLDKIDQDILSDLATKHNLTLTHDKKDNCRILMYNNLLQNNVFKKPNEDDCDEELFEHLYEENTFDYVIHREQIIRPILEDKIHSNGFIVYGNINESNNVNIFNIDNYINILKNIDSFVPIECSVFYFDKNKNVSGKIVEILNDIVIKIVLDDDKSIIYYNTDNILDNKFFLYTSLHDSYHFNKNSLFLENVYIYSSVYSIQQLFEIILFNITDYIDFNNIQFNNFQNISDFLLKFNTSFYDLSHTHFESICKHHSINVDKITTYKFKDNTKIPSKYDFMKSLENIQSDLPINNDLHNMFIFQKQPYSYVYEYCLPKYKNESSKLLSNDQKIEIEPITQFNNINAFTSFQELSDYKKIYSKYQKNLGIKSLYDNLKKYNNFINNSEGIFNKYTKHYNQCLSFQSMKHYKFFTQIIYEPKYKALDGDINDDHTSLISNKNIQYDPVESTSKKHKHNDVLHNLANLTHISYSIQEFEYIQHHTNDILLPLFVKQKTKNMKDKKVFKSKQDENNWIQFTKICIYGALFIIFAQYNDHNPTSLFNKCKDKYSLAGYPFDKSSEKSLLNYFSCILHSLFGSNNEYFNKLDNIKDIIEKITLLFLTINPEIKKILVIKKNQKQDQIKVNTNFKPMNNLDHKIIKHISENINVEKISKSYNISYKPIKNNLQPYKYNKLFNFVLSTENSKSNIINFKNTSTSSIRVNLHDNTLNYEHSIIDEFITSKSEMFIKSFNLKLQNFIDQIIIKDTVSNFPEIINFNTTLLHLLNFDYFINKKTEVFSVLRKYTYDTFYNIYTVFESIETLIKTIFSNDEPYTFANTELDVDKLNGFNKFIELTQSFFDNVIVKVDSKSFDIQHILSHNNILKEEKKKENLNKFNNLDDDDLYIILELQKMVGIDIDSLNSKKTNDDDNLDEEDISYIPSNDDENEE
jgi:hypothetical protein